VVKTAGQQLAQLGHFKVHAPQAVEDAAGRPPVGARVDKIQQPARDTVVLQLRGRDGGGRLLLSANGNRPRVHLTQAQLENPAQPPMYLYAAAQAADRRTADRDPAAGV